jgi:hypothetical protein
MWNSACPDWVERLKTGRSLVPDLPLKENGDANSRNPKTRESWAATRCTRQEGVYGRAARSAGCDPSRTWTGERSPSATPSIADMGTPNSGVNLRHAKSAGNEVSVAKLPMPQRSIGNSAGR